jgi:hypothetical protein
MTPENCAHILPEKLSDCIRKAAMDIVMCEADPRVKLDPDLWLDTGADWCSMCLAGAPFYRAGMRSFEPNDASSHDNVRMYALDSIRVGEHRAALFLMGIDSAPPSNRIPTYKVSDLEDIPALVTYLMWVAQDYQEAGL